MPRRKALKVVVDIEFHAVTCPGVFLADREDVFINVELFGQLKRTLYHPPVFPFLFHERIRFEKVFANATDPVQIAQELCGESIQMELVQVSYPGGDLLGTYKDNARDFLFPTPRVSPTYPGVDREVLFERAATFPGIAPKLEFSSRTTIKEVSSSGRSFVEKKRKERSKAQAGVVDESIPSKEKVKFSGSAIKTISPGKQKTPTKTRTTRNQTTKHGQSHQRSRSTTRGTTMWGYEQPTIASRARSPSPYVRRRMAELSIKEPFESATHSKPFKTEINYRPEFVIRKVTQDALSLDQAPPPPRSPSCERKSSRHDTNSIRKQTSPHQASYSSPRNEYELPPSNSSDDGDDPSISGENMRNLIKPRPVRPWEKPPSLIDSYNKYLMRKQDSRFPEGCCNLFIPVKNQRLYSQFTPRSAFSRHRRNSPFSCGSSIRGKQVVKPSLVTRNTPVSQSTLRYYSTGNHRKVAGRISEHFQDIFRDLVKSVALKSIGKVQEDQKTSRACARYKEASDLHTSVRCGKGSASGQLSSNSSHCERSFSLHDLDTVPTSTFGRKPDTVSNADSILNRPSIGERLRGHPSPYKKIRDRVQELLQSPRATRIAEDAMVEGEEKYRRRMSRSPSQRLSRYY